MLDVLSKISLVQIVFMPSSVMMLSVMLLVTLLLIKWLVLLILCGYLQIVSIKYFHWYPTPWPTHLCFHPHPLFLSLLLFIYLSIPRTHFLSRISLSLDVSLIPLSDFYLASHPLSSILCLSQSQSCIFLPLSFSWIP